MIKVAVVGVTGFIGSHTLKILNELPIELIATTRSLKIFNMSEGSQLRDFLSVETVE